MPQRYSRPVALGGAVIQTFVAFWMIDVISFTHFTILGCAVAILFLSLATHNWCKVIRHDARVRLRRAHSRSLKKTPRGSVISSYRLPIPTGGSEAVCCLCDGTGKVNQDRRRCSACAGLGLTTVVHQAARRPFEPVCVCPNDHYGIHLLSPVEDDPTGVRRTCIECGVNWIQLK